MSFIGRRSKLAALLIGLALTGSAFASHYQQIGTTTGVTYTPVPGLDGVEAPTFNYQNDAAITLNGFGETDVVYYQVLPWQGSGDAASATFFATTRAR